MGPNPSEEDKVICNSSVVESEEREFCTTNKDTNCQTDGTIFNTVSNSDRNSDRTERKGSKSSGTNSENGSEESETRLRVQEDWFADGKKNKKKGSSSPIRRLSPKLRKKISPKFGAGFSLTTTLRKSSSSSSSTELAEGHFNTNSDSGISLSVENSPSHQTLSSPVNVNAVSGHSSVSSTPTTGPAPYLGYCFSGFVVAMHRKIVSYMLFSLLFLNHMLISICSFFSSIKFHLTQFVCKVV